MTRRYRRHERFTISMAASPADQIVYEARQQSCRDAAADALDFVEGRSTPGAARAKAIHDRLATLNKEAKRRALVGADPLNLTHHSPNKPARKALAADPVEFVGNISRTVPSIRRLHGKNKLELRQLMAAETYRDAFETVRSILGGALNFDRVVGAGFAHRSPTQACLLAAETLTEAKRLLGTQSIVIVESIVCDGRGIEECARKLYGVEEGDKIPARDVNYVGRRLREALDELADLWHPRTRKPPTRSFRSAQEEIVAGEAGVRDIQSKPYVMP